ALAHELNERTSGDVESAVEHPPRIAPREHDQLLLAPPPPARPQRRELARGGLVAGPDLAARRHPLRCLLSDGLLSLRRPERGARARPWGVSSASRADAASGGWSAGPQATRAARARSAARPPSTRSRRSRAPAGRPPAAGPPAPLPLGHRGDAPGRDGRLPLPRQRLRCATPPSSYTHLLRC